MTVTSYDLCKKFIILCGEYDAIKNKKSEKAKTIERKIDTLEEEMRKTCVPEYLKELVDND